MTQQMIAGCDYSSPNIPPMIVAQHGFRFVCRYASTPGNPKNLTGGEATALTTSGVNIVSVFETTATRALDGHGAGMADYAAAVEQHRALGLPVGRPIYFAVDFDMTPAQWPAVRDYFHGLNDAAGLEPIGVYGGLAAVTEVFNAGLVRYIWQAAAWSGGQWHPASNIRQATQQINVNGQQVDLDWAYTADYGQWFYTYTEDTVNIQLPAGENLHCEFGTAGYSRFRLHNGFGEKVTVWYICAIGDTPGPTGADYIANLQGEPGNTTQAFEWDSDRPGPLALPAGTTQLSMRYTSDHPFYVSLATV